MAYFDEKQKNLIRSWHHRSLQTDDNYFAFMAEWIAFNAICYNLYSNKASKYRANFESKNSRLDKIEKLLDDDPMLEINKGYLISQSDKWTIDLYFSERLKISVRRFFTEDNIYNEFVKEHNDNLELIPMGLYNDLHIALKKGARHYVINMVNINKYKLENDVDQMAMHNIIVLCEIRDLQTIRRVLYQIRCNIFHGEKIPGEINDDRIVKKALPLLRHIVKSLMKQYKI